MEEDRIKRTRSAERVLFLAPSPIHCDLEWDTASMEWCPHGTMYYGHSNSGGAFFAFWLPRGVDGDGAKDVLVGAVDGDFVDAATFFPY